MLAAIAAVAVAGLGLALAASAQASSVQWRTVTDGLNNPGGGVYLTNRHSGYYMGRLQRREMFGVHDYKGSRGFGARMTDDGRVYRWGRAMGDANECLWIGPAGNGPPGDEYLGGVDGRNAASCSRVPMRALAERTNFGKAFNCPANGAVGPQRTTLSKDTGFFHNVEWVRTGDRYSVAHVAGPRRTVLPAGSTVWYRYTTRDGAKAVVFAGAADGGELGWGFVDADAVNEPDMRHWTLTGSTAQEWTCGTALDASGRHWHDTVGVTRGPSVYLSDDNNATNYALVQFNMLLGGAQPVTGDWDGDGRTEVGLYSAPYFRLPASNEPGAAVSTVALGEPGDVPVAGDWDDDGVDTVGVFRAGAFMLSDTPAPEPGQISFASVSRTLALGATGDVPLAGRWSETQQADSPAIYRAPDFFFSVPTGDPDVPGQYVQAAGAVRFGSVGDLPVAGDWDNKGYDSIGVYRAPYFMLRNTNASGDPDSVLTFGAAGDQPVAGNWDGR